MSFPIPRTTREFRSGNAALNPRPSAKVFATEAIPTRVLLCRRLTVLLLGPLAFGAVEPWSIFALEACAMLLLATWAFRQWINRELDVSGQRALSPHGGFFCAGNGAMGGRNDRIPSRDLLPLVALCRLRHDGVCGDPDSAPLFSV